MLLRLLLVFISAAALTGGPVLAASPSPVQPAMAVHAPASPIEVRSSEDGDTAAADIGGRLDQPFEHVAKLLADAAHWCEFLPLSFNIKSCTYRTEGDHSVVTLYAGRKFYQEPEDSHRLEYRFKAQPSAGGLEVVLSADQGPMGMRDSRIELLVTPAGGGTALRVHVSQRSSLMGRFAANSYFSTLGKDKVGFSVTGRDHDGQPVYVKGLKGVIERNGVRYFLAMQAHAASEGLPPAERFPARLRLWFDLTERYPHQLREMEREEYLRMKMQEWHNQRELQEAVNASSEQEEKVARKPS